MKVGDLVVYNLDPAMPGDEDPKDIAIVVNDRDRPSGSRSFRIYYPHYKDYLNGWEDEYRVISS